MNITVRKLTSAAMLAALSVMLIYLVRFPLIPSAPFLEYEPGDVPIIIGTLVYGTKLGLILTIIASFVQAVTISSASGWVGFVMHVIATGTLVTVTSLIYNRFRHMQGLTGGLALGGIAMTAMMIPTNLFFTVKFFGIPYDVVKNMLVPAIIPFNLLKSMINGCISVFVFKQLKTYLQSVL